MAGEGHRPRLLTGALRRHTDDRCDREALRDFNFVLFTAREDGLEAVVRALPKGGGAEGAMDVFFLRFSPP